MQVEIYEDAGRGEEGARQKRNNMFSQQEQKNSAGRSTFGRWAKKKKKEPQVSICHGGTIPEDTSQGRDLLERKGKIGEKKT